MRRKFTVFVVAASLVVAGSAQGQQVSHAAYEPPSDVRVGDRVGSFQSHVVAETSARVGFPHAWTRAELADIAVGVGFLHKRVRVRVGLAPAHRVVCGSERRRIQCRVLNRRGTSVAWYPVARVWEDGSVRVFLPVVPRIVVKR